MISKQQLGNTLWGMAEILYDKVEDYKTYILSLLFFKRLSDNWSWEIENKVRDFVAEHDKEPNARQRARIAAEAHDFSIPEGCFWADVKNASANEKNEKLDNALKAIAELNPPLRGIINAVQWNAPAPDGSGGKRLHPEVLTSLINYLDVVTLDNGNASVDVLGDAYEYLIKKFADENKGGKMAGQFYTPGEVVDLMVRTIKPKAGEEVYDPTCGSGGFLIRSAKYVKETTGDAKNVRLYGQESVWTTWAIASINMIFHGLHAKIAQGDTIRAPKFTVDGELQRFDVALANFPFSMENWWGNGQPKKDAKGKPVYKKDGSPQLEYPDKSTCVDPYSRFVYGIPPYSNGDFTFIQHIVSSLNDHGRAGIVCPQGVLFRGQPEKTEEEDGVKRKADDEYLIRKGLLDGSFLDAEGRKHEHINLIEAIVVLPANVFYGTSIPASILFFNKAKPAARRDKVLMVYAAREGWYKETPNFNVLLPHDVLRILVQLEAWGDIKVAKKVLPGHVARLKADIDDALSFKLEEIRENWLDTERALAELNGQLKQANTGKAKLSSSQRAVLEKRRETFEKGIAKRDAERAAAEVAAEKERHAVDAVADEVVAMLADPEQRRRYFAIVEREELEENEFNLNIPRYVDTFEPEQDIALTDAIDAFKHALSAEQSGDQDLMALLDTLRA
jgi:type I restriction enzyme M protein